MDPDWTQGKFYFKYGFWKIYDIFLHDYRYVALLGLAENFLKPSPNHPGYKVNPAGVLPAIKCLGAIFRLNPRPAPIIEARTHLQLGSLLKKETQNVDLAKQHLEQAVRYFFF